MIEIPLSMKPGSKNSGMVAIVDDCDSRLAIYKWHAVRRQGDKFKACRTIRNGRRKHKIYLHHEILGIKSARSGDIKEVLFKNDNSLDCRRSNLVVMDRVAKGGFFRIRSQDKTSRFKGVCWNQHRQLWVATIRFQQKTVNLGGFEDETEAARAYDSANRKLYGELGRRNFQDQRPGCIGVPMV